MKSPSLLLGTVAAALLIAACQPVTVPNSGGPASSDGTPVALPSLEPEVVAAQAAAAAKLAESLGVDVAAITAISATPVEFSDSCLGIPNPVALCAAVVTPGYRITLTADGTTYVVHTNEDASVVLENPARVIWGRTGGIAGVCQTLELVRGGATTAGTCGQAADVELTAEEQAQLDKWLTRFGEVRFTSDDLNGGTVVADGFVDDLYFVGTGTEMPTPEEQQAMLDWAAAVYTRLTTKP